uniref:Uncharacterized protein n=1 Tax=Timema monikensis TaxID=170555 RepID=A0A7R9HT18_9NEOP|nr:unnamed protein product [Timema monikensis]
MLIACVEAKRAIWDASSKNHSNRDIIKKLCAEIGTILDIPRKSRAKPDLNRWKARRLCYLDAADVDGWTDKSSLVRIGCFAIVLTSEKLYQGVYHSGKSGKTGTSQELEVIGEKREYVENLRVLKRRHLLKSRFRIFDHRNILAPRCREEFCAQADSKRMLKDMALALQQNPTQACVVWELAGCVSSAVGAEEYKLYLVNNRDLEQLEVYLGKDVRFSNDERKFQILGPDVSLAQFVAQTKKPLRFSRGDPGPRFRNWLLLKMLQIESTLIRNILTMH